MRKVLVAAAMTGLLLSLSACSSAEQGSAKENNQKESVIIKGELIPLDEMPILENDAEAYNNRPFKGVPVVVKDVERFSDKVIYIVGLDGINQKSYVRLAVIQRDKNTELEPGDYLLIDGVVNTKADIGDAKVRSPKVELTNMKKVNYIDKEDLVINSKELNVTQNYGDITVTLTRMDVGEEFTRFYYNATDKNGQRAETPFGGIITLNGQEIPETNDGIRLGLNMNQSLDGVLERTLVFNNFKSENGFSLTMFNNSDYLGKPEQGEQLLNFEIK